MKKEENSGQSASLNAQTPDPTMKSPSQDGIFRPKTPEVTLRRLYAQAIFDFLIQDEYTTRPLREICRTENGKPYPVIYLSGWKFVKTFAGSWKVYETTNENGDFLELTNWRTLKGIYDLITAEPIDKSPLFEFDTWSTKE